MRKLVIELDDDAFARLVRRALPERRNARDEAALIVQRAVAGDPRNSPDHAPKAEPAAPEARP